MDDEQIRRVMVMQPVFSDDADYAHMIRMGRAVENAVLAAIHGGNGTSTLLDEALAQALHCAEFLRQHLLEAGKAATAVESMALMPLIREAATQYAAIAHFIQARRNDAQVVVEATFGAPDPLHIPRHQPLNPR